MAERMVKCVKFGKELPGLEEPPWEGELGKRIYENVSQEAWKLWFEHLKMIINEYRLNLMTAQGNAIYDQHLKEFLGLEE